MTSTPRQSGSIPPWYMGEHKDTQESAKVKDGDATAPQGIAVVGTGIPVVFGKHVGGSGGVWVSPPAARYGVHYDQGGNAIKSYVGTVVSDGEIGAIAAADVYRGATRITDVKNGVSVFRYNAMPDLSDGFDYSVGGTATEDRLDLIETRVYAKYTWTAVGTMKVDIKDLRFGRGTGGQTTVAMGYKITRNGATISSNPPNSYTTELDKSYTFSEPCTVVVEIWLAPGENANVTVFGQIGYTSEKTIAAGASPVGGGPVFGGEGGTFQGLSCLAARGEYLYSTEGTADAMLVKLPNSWRSASFSGTAWHKPISLPAVRSVSFEKLEIRFAGWVDQAVPSDNTLFHYRIYADGVKITGNEVNGIYSSSLTWSYDFPKAVKLEMEVRMPYPDSRGNTLLYLINGHFNYEDEALSKDGIAMTFTDGVRCFVRDGVKTENLLTGATGSSNNFADLALYLLRVCGRVPDELIDFDALRIAAQFTVNQGFAYNAVLAGAGNVRSYLQSVAPFYLLQFAQVEGRFALIPILPITAESQLSTDPSPIALTLTQDTIVAGSYSRQYIAAADRTDAIALVTWRNHSNANYAITTVEEIRYESTPSEAPMLRYDAEEFCTSATHARAIGRFVLAKRKHVTHRVSFAVPVEIAGALKPQDVITIDLAATSSVGSAVADLTPYWVQALTDSGDGLVQVEAEHFPLDSSGVSLITLELLNLP